MDAPNMLSSTIVLFGTSSVMVHFVLNIFLLLLKLPKFLLRVFLISNILGLHSIYCGFLLVRLSRCYNGNIQPAIYLTFSYSNSIESLASHQPREEDEKEKEMNLVFNPHDRFEKAASFYNEGYSCSSETKTSIVSILILQ